MKKFKDLTDYEKHIALIGKDLKEDSVPEDALHDIADSILLDESGEKSCKEFLERIGVIDIVGRLADDIYVAYQRA